MAARVLIVDDHAEFRALARDMLEGPMFTVVGEAASAAQAMTAVRIIRPDVLLLDVQLPDADGLTVCRAVRRLFPSVCVVLCSVRPGEAYGPALLECGARGFLSKEDLSPQSLARVIDGD